MRYLRSSGTLRPLRISTKLALGLTATSTIILGSFGLSQLWQEEIDLRKTAEHDTRLLATALQVAVEKALRDRQEADIRAILDELGHGDAGIEVLVFDTAGRLTANSRGSSRTAEILRGTAVEVGSHNLPVVRFEGLSQLVAILPLRADDGSSLGSMVLVRPLAELRRDLAAETLWTILLILTLLAGITSVNWLLVQLQVRRPLAGLIRAMGAVRAGDLTASVPSHRTDEVGALAGEFNSMVGELREARRQLIEAAESREALEAGLQRVDKLVTVGQLSAGLAHEIGSPLQILNGRAHALTGRADLPAEVRRSAQILVEQSDRITRIVEQLLSFARRRAAHMGEVDLAATVEAVVDLLQPETRRRAVRLDFERADTLPRVLADADQVQQVTMNLLSNALRATARGGRVRIGVMPSSFKAAEGAREQASVSLIVEDTGSGIPPEALTHIFEPFFTTWGEAGGAGLGLAVVTSIVHEHGGLIAVSSAPGSGSRFTVHFPVAGVARAEGLIA